MGENKNTDLDSIKVGDIYHYKEGRFIGYVTVLEDNSTDDEYSFKLQTELSNREPFGENGIFTIGMSRKIDFKGYGINLENTVYKFAPAWERQESFITKAKGSILFV